jgi:hypothetical protein
MVGTEIGILHKLQMPPAPGEPVFARAQALTEGSVDLMLVHRFAERRAYVEMDVRFEGEAFGNQLRARELLSMIAIVPRHGLRDVAPDNPNKRVRLKYLTLGLFETMVDWTISHQRRGGADKR